MQDIVENNDLKQQGKILNRATDRITLAHRNTKLFLFFMSGPCLLLLMVIKYSIKVIVLYYIYQNNKKKKEAAAVAEALAKEGSQEI